MSEFLKYDENETILSQSAGRVLGSIVAKFKTHKFMGYNTFTQLYETCPVMVYAVYAQRLNVIQNRG